MNAEACDPDPIRYAVGEFVVDLLERKLLRSGIRVQVQPRTFDLLAHFLAHPDELQRKEQLLQEVWGGAHVTDNSLTRSVHQLRAALGDDPEAPRYIETVSGTGYRFIAPVRSYPDEAPPRPVRNSWTAISATLALGLIVLSLLFWWKIPANQVDFPPARPSIAVLPLDNLSGDQSQQYVADAMTEELITELARVATIDVISRTSVMRYQDQRPPLPQIGEELNVDWLIEGAVSREKERFRVTVHLIHAATDTSVWSERFDRGVSSVLDLRSDVARAVATWLKLELRTGDRNLLSRTRSVDPEAYDLYLQAISEGWQSQDAMKQRLPFSFADRLVKLERVVALDPDFADAWAELAMARLSHAISADYQARPAEFARARAAAQRALEIDGYLTRAYIVLGDVLQARDRDLPGARRMYERALLYNPSDPYAININGRALLMAGEREPGLALCDRLSDIAPVEVTWSDERVRCFFYAREYEQAIAQREKLRDDDPDLFPSVISLRALDRFDQHREAFLRWLYRCGAPCKEVAASYASGWREGRRAGALRAINTLAKRADQPRPTVIAYNHAQLGENDMAFEWLERAYREYAFLDDLAVSVDWDPLRSDPRFDDLLRRVGFSNPKIDPGVLAGTGKALALSGRPDSALRQLSEAMGRNPNDSRMARWHYYEALTHFAAERYVNAVKSAETAFLHDPAEYTIEDLRLVLASSLAHLSRLDEARQAGVYLQALWPEFTVGMEPLPPYTDAGFRSRYRRGLLMAGLQGEKTVNFLE